MNKKTWEVIGAIAIVLILIVVVITALYSGRAPEDQGEDISDTVPYVEFPEEIDLSGPVEYTPNPVARAFVERFGSFSSESDYANIDDVMALATQSLQARLYNIAEEARNSISGSYYGVSTRVIAMEVVEESETSALVHLTTQREESIDSPANTSMTYQDIDIDMVRIGDDWFVDDFQWN